jgi:hypothetical protein
MFTTNFCPGLFSPYFPDNLVELDLLLFPEFNFARIATITAQFHKFRNIPDSGLPTALPVNQKTSRTRFQGMPRHTSVWCIKKNFITLIIFRLPYSCPFTGLLWTPLRNHNPGQIPDVNRDSLRSPIGVWQVKRSPICALIIKVLNSGSVWQTDDFIEPQNMGWILRIRKDPSSRPMGIPWASGTPLSGFYGCAE